MTDLAERGETQNLDGASFIEPKPGTLGIKTSLPSTVYVKAYPQTGTPTIAGFGMSQSGTFYKDGIEWQSNGEYAMFITFVLLPGVASVDCADLPYSPTYGATQINQDLCILKAAPKTYDFYVRFPGGTRHDPKIVVTPPSLPGG
jgi:hypothetical protein